MSDQAICILDNPAQLRVVISTDGSTLYVWAADLIVLKARIATLEIEDRRANSAL